MKYFTRNNDSSKNGGGSNPASSGTATNGLVDSGVQNGTGSLHCRSANCCGMQRVLSQLNSHNDVPQQQPHHHAKYRQQSQESLNSSHSSALNGSSSPALDATDSKDDNEELWLECDDENISVIPRRQFEEELNSKQGATTPYLLFYERV